MIKTVERSSEFGSARDKTVSAMGFSPFTQLDSHSSFALIPKAGAYPQWMRRNSHFAKERA
jgi:hypothetical protein